MTRSPPTRATLLMRLRDPADAEAWATFSSDYAPVLFRFLRRRGLQDADAADLLQDVMRSVSIAIQDLQYEKNRGGFRAWLFRITRNRLYTWLEKSRRHDGDTRGTAAHEIIGQTPSDDNELQQQWEQEHQRQLLKKAVDEVQPLFASNTWEAFKRTAMEGNTASEVSGELAMSIGAIYVARSRVTAKLREVVERLEREEDE